MGIREIKSTVSGAVKSAGNSFKEKVGQFGSRKRKVQAAKGERSDPRPPVNAEANLKESIANAHKLNDYVYSKTQQLEKMKNSNPVLEEVISKQLDELQTLRGDAQIQLKKQIETNLKTLSEL